MRVKDSLGDRMKGYEKERRDYLNLKEPVIMRLDGKAFHTFAQRHCTKPFDRFMTLSMIAAACETSSKISGAKLAYTQSDEISIFITDYDREETQAWFAYNIQKMVSVGAAMTSIAFSEEFSYLRNIEQYDDWLVGLFDCRVFNIPKNDVANYFIWRQRDWERNSVQMLARAFHSQKALQGKSISEQKYMIEEKIREIKKLQSGSRIISEHERILKRLGNIYSWDDLHPTMKYGNIIQNLYGISDWNLDINIERFEYEKFISKYISNFV